MDELISILGEIKDQLVELNRKFDNLANTASINTLEIVSAYFGLMQASKNGTVNNFV
jgi:hypothetical protein